MVGRCPTAIELTYHCDLSESHRQAEKPESTKVIGWLRLLAVAPRACRAGVGSALLARCELLAKTDGQTKLSALDQPGNYLAPGIDARNLHAIAWL